MDIKKWSDLPESHAMEGWPYTNLHDLNLDWIINTTKSAVTEINRFESDVTEKVDELDDKIENAIDTIIPETIEEEIDSRFDQITNANIKSVAADRKIIFIGDSYGTGEGSDGSYNSYVDVCAQALGLVENVSYWKRAQGGASFVGWDSRPRFIALLQSLAADIEEPDLISDIFVGGGVNDAFNGQAVVSQSLQAMQEFVQYCHTTYKNATVHVGLVGWGVNANLRLYINQKSLPVYMVAGYAGAGAVDLRHLNHDYANFQSDGVHPNQTGHRLIGWGLASYLVNGRPEYGLTYQEKLLTLNNTIFNTNTSSPVYITETPGSNSMQISMPRARLYMAEGQTLSTEGEITLGTFTGPSYISHGGYTGGIPVTMTIIGTSEGANVMETTNGFITLEYSTNGITTVKMIPYLSRTFSSVAQILIPAQMLQNIPISNC